MQAIQSKELETFRDEKGTVAVIVETPKGSRNKISYKEGVFQLSGVLPEGSIFPYDFGFLPSTNGDDGDPLDVLVLLDESVPMGCMVEARLIGVIEAEQKEPGHETERNDRLIAVATHAHTHQHVHKLEDLRPGLIDEIEHFFVGYNEVKGKQFRPVGRGG
ncbi:MAG TPA: inorganic diphosphatase, partial [Rhizomicrobium sp.]|nr:inorganic diphosphatase [Rhizomicrobium sp.]